MITARKVTAARLAACKEATADEIARYNAAVKALREAGTPVLVETAFGPYEVASVNADFDVLTYTPGHFGSYLYQRTFMWCNDGRWARRLAEVGVGRNPLFADA